MKKTLIFGLIASMLLLAACSSDPEVIQEPDQVEEQGTDTTTETDASVDDTAVDDMDDVDGALEDLDFDDW